ncbi:hypothetical protein JCM33374_g2712 [Metschnikowia sp. JCM 33374]|nr:hypothetical protein JCM33374_g2712 [Metschnikowia sp. JCM 33374]
MLPILTLLSLSLSLVHGLVVPDLQPKDRSTPLQLDFKVSHTVGNITAREFWANHQSQTSKRGVSSQVIVDYRDLCYHIDVYLGSNKQKNTVILDTGSADLWVPHEGYSPDLSSTSKSTSDQFSIGYIDGSEASGDIFLDTLTFETEQPVLPNFLFARASSNADFGVLGIADKGQEAVDYTYNNLPWALQAAGVIPKASYSLFLGPRGGSGSLVLGGIDTEKYIGELAQYAIDNDSGGLGVKVNSVSVGGHPVAVDAAMLLDSGTTLGLLNHALMAELDVAFSTTIKDIGGVQYRYTSCHQPSDKYLHFNFGSNTIAIPYSEAIFKQNDGTCLLGFGWYQDLQILGDIFLRHAYVYYNLSDQTISLAQASYSESSNIISA